MEISWRTRVEDKQKNLQESFWAPLEVSHDHLPVNPLSHFMPQKVRDFVVGFTWLGESETIIKEILSISMPVKGKIAFGDNLFFMPKLMTCV